MAFYHSEDQFYECLNRLFDQVRKQNPNPIDQLSVARLIIRLKFSDPDAEILVNGRYKPVKVQFGASKHLISPDLEAIMAADTFHQIMIQELSLKSAVSSRKMKVAGALWKTNSLGTILERGQALYPKILLEKGYL